MLAMPEPLRPPMLNVQNDLSEMNMELLKLLFPRRPGEQPPLDPRASTPKNDEATGEAALRNLLAKTLTRLL